MSFLPFPTVSNFHLNLNPALVSENLINITKTKKTEVLSFDNNSNFKNTQLIVAGLGATFQAKLDVFTAGLSLELQERYFKQSWSKTDSTLLQTFLLTQASYGLVVGVRPNQNWDADVSLLMSTHLVGSSKRSGDEQSGSFKITSSNSHTLRSMIHFVHFNKTTIGFGGEYLLGSMRLDSTDDSSVARCWFYSGYGAVLQSRWEL